MKKYLVYYFYLYFISFFLKQAFLYFFYSSILTLDTMLLILCRHVILHAIALTNSTVTKSALIFTVLIVFACSIE